MLSFVFAVALVQEPLTLSRPPLPDLHRVSHEIVCGEAALGLRYAQSARPSGAGGVELQTVVTVSGPQGAGEAMSARLSGRFSAIGEVGAQCRSPAGAVVRFTAAEPDGPFETFELVLDAQGELHLIQTDEPSR